MEFNKSNRFNDDENQVNKNLVHYKGVLGEFDYDPDIWEILDNRLRFKNRKVKSLPEDLELPKGCVDTSYMFFGCDALTDLSALENWDTSNVIDMSWMFKHCRNITNISSLENFDTSKVEDMSGMFYNCTNLTNISPLENWDT